MAAEAKHRALPVVGAGRSAERVAAAARTLDAPPRTFGLDDPRVLAGVSVLVNCAGPFAHTVAPLARTCIAAKVHYLDIAGEVREIEAVRALDPPAPAAEETFGPVTPVKSFRTIDDVRATTVDAGALINGSAQR